jgi:Spy/CpxP family protein refolding chaperone
MKNALVAAALLGSSLALAQTNQPAPPNGPGPHGGLQGQPSEQRFEEVKAKHLEHIGKRIAELQQVQSCVQAANNPEALHACRPQHRHN